MSSRIYAAEDDDNIREILRCTLESYGYEVEVFESAAPMLERMRQRKVVRMADKVQHVIKRSK